MKKKINKKAFTLIELVIVIGIVALIMFIFATSNYGRNLTKPLTKQVVKDFIVNKVDQVRNYAYNNKTIGQELLDDTVSSDTTNIAVSRLNGQKATIHHDDSQVAYYHALYFTIHQNGTLDPNDKENKYIYHLQYKQEGFDNLENRVYKPFVIDYETSPQLIKNHNEKWTEKWKYPSYSPVFLNKIIQYQNSYIDNNDEACRTESNDYNNVYILFNSSNLNYKVYRNDGTLDPNFDYLFCFSATEEEFDDKTGFGIRINRDRLTELSNETFRNY